MACTTWTMEQYLALAAAIAGGVKSVKYADKLVQYQSLDEMRSLLDSMAQCLEIGIYAPSGQGRRRIAVFNSGL